MAFLKKRIRSFGYAFKGIGKLVASQRNAQIHLVATIVVILAGWGMTIKALEWALLMLAMGSVWSAEAMNTAIEILADKVEPGYDEQIGRVKDVAAGGVLLSAIFATLMGAWIFIPRLIALF